MKVSRSMTKEEFAETWEYQNIKREFEMMLDYWRMRKERENVGTNCTYYRTMEQYCEGRIKGLILAINHYCGTDIKMEDGDIYFGAELVLSPELEPETEE